METRVYAPPSSFQLQQQAGDYFKQQIESAHMFKTHSELLSKIRSGNSNVNDLVQSLARMACPLVDKIHTSCVIQFIQKNSKSASTLQALIGGMEVLEKYGRNLLKPASARPTMWKAVKFSNGVFRSRVDSLQDARKMLSAFGYTCEIEDGQAFPDLAMVNTEEVAKITTDLLVARTILQQYVTGKCEQPGSVESLIGARIRQSVTAAAADLNPAIETHRQAGTDILISPEFKHGRPGEKYIRYPASEQNIIPTTYRYSGSEQNIVPTTRRYPGSEQNIIPTTHRYPGSEQNIIPTTHRYPGSEQNIVPTNYRYSGSEQEFITTTTRYSQNVSPTTYRPDIMTEGVQSWKSPDPVTQLATVTTTRAPDLQSSENVKQLSDNDGMVCDICGQSSVKYLCRWCDNKILCKECDQKWHQHPKRTSHERVPVSLSQPSYDPYSGLLKSQKNPYLSAVQTISPTETPNLSTFIDTDKNDTSKIPFRPHRPEKPLHLRSKLLSSSEPELTVEHGTHMPALPKSQSNTEFAGQIENNIKFPPSQTLINPLTESQTLPRQVYHGYSEIMGQFTPSNRRISYPPSGYSSEASVPSSFPSEPIHKLEDYCQYCGRMTDYSATECTYCHRPILPEYRDRVLQHIIQSKKEPEYETLKPASFNIDVVGSQRLPVENVEKSRPTSTSYQWECGHCTVLNPGDNKVCFVCSRTTDKPKIIIEGDMKGEYGPQDNDNSNTITNLHLYEEVLPPDIGSADGLQMRQKPVTGVQPAPISKPVLPSSVKEGNHGYQMTRKPVTMETGSGVQPAASVSQVSPSSGLTGGFLNNVRKYLWPGTSEEHKPAVSNTTLPSSGPEPQQSLNQPGGEPYRSIFVDYQDDIAREKKEAHERYRRQLQLEEQEKQRHEQTSSAQPASNYQSDVKCLKSPVGGSTYATVSTTPNVTTSPHKTFSMSASHGVETSGSTEKHKASDTAFTRHEDSTTSKSPPSSMENTSLGSDLVHMETLKMQQDLITNGKRMIQLLRFSTNDGFSPEEFTLGLRQDKENPLKWLKTEYADQARTVTDMALAQFPAGKISLSEAKSALVKCGGDITMATDRCIRDRQLQIKEVKDYGDFDDKLVCNALLHNEGDVSAAIQQLNQQQCAAIQAEHMQAEHQGQVIPRPKPSRAAYLQDPEFIQLVKDKNIDLERRIRLLFVEACLMSWGRARSVINILDMDDVDFALSDIIEAVVSSRGDLTSSLSYLQKECSVCFSEIPMSKIYTLVHCQCMICVDCMKQNFEITIREKNVKKMVCPVCQLPDVENLEQADTHFTLLDGMLKGLVDGEVHELFQRKLRDWNLMKDPNFRWCSHCANGFIFAPEQEGQLKMNCPHCRAKTCFLCKKPWEAQHEGLTCEQFQQWKEDNDPEAQAAGVARHLQENGIDCPHCKFRYVLAKGGCMHFKCVQCGHEFCSGCYNPFKRNCTLYRTCDKAGLHCHHPRDCLFYLRDRDIKDLQKLLKDHKVDYNFRPPEGNTGTCQVMEQKEDATGLMDDMCGKPVEVNSAGLCNIHYKEYLVNLINKRHIDPVVMMNEEELTILLNRENKNVPKRVENQTHKQYQKDLIEKVRREIPLPARPMHAR